MNLILVGYRGCGKSTVGKILAKRLGWRYVDLDQCIVEQAGKTIRQVFEEEGEEGFRRRERDAFLRIRRSRNCVFGLGGGALEDPDNRSLVKRLGKVVWLRAPAVLLWSRIRNDPVTADSRPDLTPEGGLAEVEQKLAEREPIYRRAAQHIVDTISQSPDEIADAIELWFRANDNSKA